MSTVFHANPDPPMENYIFWLDEARRYHERLLRGDALSATDSLLLIGGTAYLLTLGLTRHALHVEQWEVVCASLSLGLMVDLFAHLALTPTVPSDRA